MCKKFLSFSTMAVCLQIILTLAFLLEVESNIGFCVDKQCFSVHEDMADFSAAKEVCEQSRGHLLTVRSTATNSSISTLLGSLVGEFWIGLHFDGSCPVSASGLKGYKWITGEEEGDFRNWGNDDDLCPTSRRCVTVSAGDLKWRERPCTDNAAGFICEFGSDISCQQLQSEKHSQIQTYQTPFNFEGPDLTIVPFGSVAKFDDGAQYICIGDWHKSPWSCEVLNGGCEHKCTTVNSKRVCTCPPGYLVDSNGRSCSPSANDPCAQSRCEHVCIPQNGSFSCLCNHGFSLDADGKSCKDIDDCADERICAGAHVSCENTHGGFECTCEKGFEMEKGFCVDINECFNGPCEHNCINTAGSYKCSCWEGYKISEEDHLVCKLHCPHSECPAVCDPNDIYDCKCPEGFILDVRSNGRFCVDIDECNMFACDQHCDNSFGGYTCWCGEGYNLVGEFRCEPIDGSGFTPPYDPVSPTIKYTTESPSVVTAGSLLGIIVCTVCGLLALFLLAHHCMKRRSEHALIGARKSNDLHDLEQITTGHYKPNFSDTQLKGER